MSPVTFYRIAAAVCLLLGVLAEGFATRLPHGARRLGCRLGGAGAIVGGMLLAFLLVPVPLVG